MKVLIGYDGSRSSDKALDDLQKAGLREAGVEALIMSVAEVWMPPPRSTNGDGFSEEDYPKIVNEWSQARLRAAESLIHEAETLSLHAKERVLAAHPDWKVSSTAAHGSPAWEILARADEFKPDLIVVGSQGRNAISRILLGSISQKVLTEAKCSVRIARGRIEVDPSSSRIVVGFDGSPGSKMAVKQVVSRSWGKQAEVCLVAAVDSLVPTAIGRFIPPVTDIIKEEALIEVNSIRALAESSILELEDAGLTVKLDIQDGNPKQILVEHAADWHADCIFIGAHSYTAVERYLIGSTSTAVAERAPCSVEVVRGVPV